MSHKCRAYGQYSKTFRSFDTSEHIRTLLNNAMKKAFHAGWDAAMLHKQGENVILTLPERFEDMEEGYVKQSS